MTGRISIVIHYFPPHLGGMEEVAAQQAASLAARGLDVTVLTLSHERGLPRTDRAPAGYEVKRRAALNVVERRFGVTFPVPTPFFPLSAWKELRRADAVHVHDVFYLTSHLTAVVARLLGKPLYLTQHVAMVEHPSRLVMAVQHLIYRTVGARMVRQARRIVVYNTNVRDHLLEMGADPARITLNHNGIDTAYFSPASDDDKRRLRAEYSLPTDRPVVLFVGRLVPKKGFDLVFNARGHDHTTVIAGVGAVPRHMEGAEDVIFFGPADRRQVRDLYRLADVFVFPTVGEVFTLVMQEAMACGLPVITTNDPAYANYDLEGEPCVLVDRNEQAVADALGGLLASPERRAKIGRSARHLAEERFSWRANYEREFAIYRDDGPRRPVVYVSAYYPPALGGVEKVAESLAQAMSHNRTVTVLTSTIGGTARGGAVRGSAVDVRRLRTVVLAKVPLMPALPFQLLRQPRNAIVHVHVAQALVPDIVWLTSRLRRREYIAHFHLDIEPSGPFGRVFVHYKRLVLGRVLRGATHVIALTDAQRDFLEHRYQVAPERIVVVPNGVDPAFAVEAPAARHDSTLRLLFVGRLSPQKNLPLLLEAMAQVRSAAELTIVGDGEDRGELTRLVRSLGLTNVHIAGAAHGQQLVDWYRWADVFVITSEREGMPLVLLEAMAAGLALIGTDVPGIRDTIRDDGFLVEPDAGSIATMIEKLADDESLRLHFAERSHRRGGEHRWETLAETYDDVYETVAP